MLLLYLLFLYFGSEIYFNQGLNQGVHKTGLQEDNVKDDFMGLFIPFEYVTDLSTIPI